MEFFLSTVASPIGELLLVTDAAGAIRALEFADHRSHLNRGLRQRYGTVTLTPVPAPAAITEALGRYFAGDIQALESLTVAAEGNELQRQIWDAVRRIPAHTTTSYGALAKSLGFTDPRAAIDVGAANAANPVALIVPCHRVVASDGSLKGYAWGIHRKQWLLTHENAAASQPDLLKASAHEGSAP